MAFFCRLWGRRSGNHDAAGTKKSGDWGRGAGCPGLGGRLVGWGNVSQAQTIHAVISVDGLARLGANLDADEDNMRRGVRQPGAQGQLDLVVIDKKHSRPSSC